MASDDVAAFQRADSQAAAADGQGNVAAGVLHVRSVAQNPLDPSIDLRKMTKVCVDQYPIALLSLL